jgi:hypothetical protein
VEQIAEQTTNRPTFSLPGDVDHAHSGLPRERDAA